MSRGGYAPQWRSGDPAFQKLPESTVLLFGSTQGAGVQPARATEDPSLRQQRRLVGAWLASSERLESPQPIPVCITQVVKVIRI